MEKVKNFLISILLVTEIVIAVSWFWIMFSEKNIFLFSLPICFFMTQLILTVRVCKKEDKNIKKIIIVQTIVNFTSFIVCIVATLSGFIEDLF